ncbi:cytochrome P450 [Ceratobasidium sp. AG-I]|nr:cytochrome P450 [Ceratobasidium sp. AG-I]
MSSLLPPLPVFALVGASLIGILLWYYKPRAYKRLPPSPESHWLWGNKEQLAMGYRSMVIGTKYKESLGDIICLKAPFQTTIMLNSADLTTEVFEKHASVTSDRPKNLTILDMSGLSATAVFRPHDEYHRKLRRVMASALNTSAARAYAEQHESTTADFLYNLSLRPHEFYRCLKDAVGGFIMQMVYDHKILKDDPFMGVMLANVAFAIESMSKHYWVNDLPFLRHIPTWFPGAGFKRKALGILDMRLQYATQTFKSVTEKVRTNSINHPSYVSRLLELKGGVNVSNEDSELIKWSAAAMFGAGSSTTTGAITIFTVMMALNPEVAKKVQDEIDRVIGRDRIPNLGDREALPYFDAALQEVLRIAPTVPLGLSHYASEDIEIRGYTIPKGATIHYGTHTCGFSALHLRNIQNPQVKCGNRRRQLARAAALAIKTAEQVRESPKNRIWSAVSRCGKTAHLGSIVIEGNIWAILHDPEHYHSPNTFDPSRFLGANPAPDPRKYIFGFGRRICPGLHVANNSTWIMCAGLMSLYDIRPSPELSALANSVGEETWKLFQPFESMAPLVFGCDIAPRDATAGALLSNLKAE